MTTLGDLCLAPLDPTHGVPCGIPGYQGYNFAVELAISSPSNQLPFKLGTSKLGGPRWRDVTMDVQGLAWVRGGEPAQRPIAGALQCRLLNTNTMKWSPWVSNYYGPGTLMRVALGNGTRTVTAFTGLIQSWNEGSVGLLAYEWTDLIAWEVAYTIGEVNNHALAGVVGGGENVDARIARLLTEAEWQFGTDIVCTSPATFQATDLASDVATELFKTVDSTGCTVWPGKDGKLMIRDRDTGTGVHWVLAHDDQNPDTLTTANDDERILSSVDLARVGGTFVHFENVGIAGRYQRRTTQRTDLITVAEPGDADLARVAAGMLARARQTYRPVSVEVQSGHGADVAALIIESDITDRLTLDHGLGGGSETAWVVPNGSSGWATGVDIYGAGSAHVALADNNDQTYVGLATTGVEHLDFATFTVPAQSWVLGLRLSVRYLISSPVTEPATLILNIGATRIGKFTLGPIPTNVWTTVLFPPISMNLTQAQIDTIAAVFSTPASSANLYAVSSVQVGIVYASAGMPPKSVVTFTDYSICGLHHAVQVSGAGVYWTCQVVLDIESDSIWEKTI